MCSKITGKRLKIVLHKNINIWLAKKYQYFCKNSLQNSFYSPSLIFLKEMLSLLKRLHKMMTVCDPVFSLAITLGPKTLFQPLIESITVASHPLFHAFLHCCLFYFSLSPPSCLFSFPLFCVLKTMQCNFLSTAAADNFTG